jgi:hypothetical protein
VRWEGGGLVTSRRFIYASKYYYNKFTPSFMRSPCKLVQRTIYKNQYIFLDTTPCSPLKTNQCFGGTCPLHLEGRRINQARNRHEAGSKQRWSRQVPPKRRLNFNGPHRVISQHIELFQALHLLTGSC